VSAVRLVPGFGLVLLLVCALCAGQSLGDAARIRLNLGVRSGTL
jgi:hypothetical protein